MANDIIIPGYEQSVGAKLLAIVDHYGPTSYNPVTGDIYRGSNLQRSGFDRVSAGTTFSGNYVVSVLYPSGYQGIGVPQVTLNWSYPAASSAVTTPGSPLTLGTLSAAATLSAYSANGVATVTGVNTLAPGNFILLSNGATAKGIFFNGAIVQVLTATPTTYTFNFGAAKALTYASAADTLKYQVVQVNSSNLLQPGTTVAPVTAVAVASNVLTVTAVNSFSPGQFVVLQGLAAGEVPQGAIVQIVTATGTGFTANLIAPNLSATTGETGTATLLVTNGQAPITANTTVAPISGSTVAATAASSSAAGAITVLPVTQNFSAGNIIVVQGLTHGAALNGLITPVLAASLSSTNVTTNGYIATAVTTGTSDAGTAGLLTTGSPTAGPSVISGTNLSAEIVRLECLMY